jgi:hypothetical protein
MADDEELMSGEEEEEIEPEMPQEEVWANILLASKKNDLELLTEMLEKWKDDFTVVQMAMLTFVTESVDPSVPQLR